LLQLCRCQKQPCTNTTFLRFANVTSGFPGNERVLVLNLYPIRCRVLRTSSSGRVFDPRILRIFSERCCGVRRSTLSPAVQNQRGSFGVGLIVFLSLMGAPSAEACFEENYTLVVNWDVATNGALEALRASDVIPIVLSADQRFVLLPHSVALRPLLR
jgi:hypothetical protein